MKKTLFLLIIILSVSSFYSQSNKAFEIKYIDSLNQVLKTSTVDSVYLKAYSNVVKYYVKSNSDTSLALINIGISEAIKRNNIKYEAQFLAYKGRSFKFNKELDSSVFYYELAMTKFLANNDSVGYMATVSNLANSLKSQGKYEDATTNFIKAINYFEKFSDEKNQKKSIVGKLNLAGIYIPLKEYEKGSKLLSDIVDHPIVKNSNKLYGIICINQVAFLTGLGKEDEAIYYANEAEKIIKNKYSLANLYNNIGAMYDKKKEFKKSLEYHIKALENFELINRISGVMKSYNNIGNVYTKLGAYDKAEYYLLKAKDLIIRDENIEMLSIRTNYNCFVKLYEKTGNYKKAYENSKVLAQLNDSIMGLDTKKALIELETKYETEKTIKERKLAEANEQISLTRAENSRKWSIGAFIFAGVVALLLLFIFSRLKLIRKQKKELDKAYEILEESKRYELAASNLKALKSQMNPHFIFNSLNSIQDLILKEDTDSSYDYIVLFAELVRNTLTYSNNEFIPLYKEVDFLSVYLKLEELRFGEEFKYDIITNGIDAIKVPSLIIQPFLENSLKHGLLHKEGIKKLTLEFKMDEELTCIITDNGVGREESARIQKRRGTKTHESFAMSAIEERLNLLSDQLNKKFSFDVEDLYKNELAQGTRITVVIPFEDEF